MLLMNNFPKLANPEQYECQLWLYNKNLSELVIRVSKLDEAFDNGFFFIFQMVAWIEAPTRWQGASFAVGSDEICTKMLQQSGKHPQQVIEAGLYRLFACQYEGGEVKIIAGGASCCEAKAFL